MTTLIKLDAPRRLHVVGVGGPGMSAIAIALAEMGHAVSGSDLREHPVLERVRAAGVAVHVGHDRALVHSVDAVTASSAIPRHNIELDEARQTGVTVLTRAGMLASICAEAQSLAVAGTHGKTTTTSMLMLILAEAGMRPSFVDRRRRHRRRHRGAVDRVDVVRGRGRRERRDASRTSAARTIADER